MGIERMSKINSSSMNMSQSASGVWTICSASSRYRSDASMSAIIVFDIVEFVFFFLTIPVVTELTVERTTICITSFDNIVIASVLRMIVVLTRIL